MARPRSPISLTFPKNPPLSPRTSSRMNSQSKASLPSLQALRAPRLSQPLSPIKIPTIRTQSSARPGSPIQIPAIRSLVRPVSIKSPDKARIRSPIRLSMSAVRPLSPQNRRIQSPRETRAVEIQLDIRDFKEGYSVAQQQQRSHEDTYQIKMLGPFRYFAIFDGHGSRNGLTNNHVAVYARNHLHEALVQAFQNINFNDELEVKYAIINVFANFDAQMFEEKNKHGTTCTIVLIDDVNDKIYQINLGDSRSILFTNSNIISETSDHSPIDVEEYNYLLSNGKLVSQLRIDETNRILNADGYVDQNRVDGSLAVSRAFGDFKFKSYHGHEYHPYNNKVSTFPDIIVTPKRLAKHFLLTSDAPFEANHYNNESLVSLANNASGNVAYDMVQKIRPDTTDDITIIYGDVEIAIPF
jgi:serine/threonine protein phosphatase PrpC